MNETEVEKIISSLVKILNTKGNDEDEWGNEGFSGGEMGAAVDDVFEEYNLYGCSGEEKKEILIARTKKNAPVDKTIDAGELDKI